MLFALQLWWRLKGNLMRLNCHLGFCKFCNFENYFPHSSRVKNAPQTQSIWNRSPYLTTLCNQRKYIFGCPFWPKVWNQFSPTWQTGVLWASAKILEMLGSLFKLTAKYQNGVAVILQRTFSFLCCGCTKCVHFNIFQMSKKSFNWEMFGSL